MNSVQALDFAVRILSNRQRRLRPRPDDAVTPNPTADAIETLTALRETIAERAHPGPYCPCDICQSRIP